MAVESSHLRNCKDTDGTKASCSNRKYFTVCYVSTKFGICGTLKTEECDVSRNNIAFKCSVGNFDWKGTSHDLLIFHLTEGQLAGSGVSAVESHKCIFQCIAGIFALDILIVQILWYGVVDVEKGYSIQAYSSSDELRKCSVDVYLTGYRNAFCCQTAVYIAWYETKLCLECRPAFASDSNIFAVTFVIFDPVKKSQLILGKFLKDFRFLITCTQFVLHIFYNFRNSFVACMIIKCLEKIKL